MAIFGSVAWDGRRIHNNFCRISATSDKSVVLKWYFSSGQ